MTRNRRQHEDHGSGMAVLNPVGDSVAVTPAPKKRQRACGACGEVGHRRDNEKCSKHVEHSTPRHDESEEQVQVALI